ncbi:hypothetical protein [Granulicoccus sp. GXG6511]|uniref:hypothetical protein n=1 Tax=Granulicoccus sp. GXG6511 TaxID=3381351 RepID=UPI003D7F0182
MEILLAAVPARAILAGKVIGNSLLAFGQVLLYALVLSVGILAATTAVVIWFAARVCERSTLKTGQAVKWSQALKK